MPYARILGLAKGATFHANASSLDGPVKTLDLDGEIVLKDHVFLHAFGPTVNAPTLSLDDPKDKDVQAIHLYLVKLK